jgi:hypothetical protein
MSMIVIDNENQWCGPVRHLPLPSTPDDVTRDHLQIRRNRTGVQEHGEQSLWIYFIHTYPINKGESEFKGLGV